jgi:hypothetical protein
MSSRREAPRSTILSFNSVDRLLLGDFFHSVTPAAVCNDLRTYPPHWPVMGLGTTNWFRRNGELLIDGSAAEPHFWWADPLAEPPGSISLLDASRDQLVGHGWVSPALNEELGRPHFPFAAVAVCDPAVPNRRARLNDGQDVYTGIAEVCEEANLGLAALRVRGPIRTVEYQTMCHIPVGGIREGSPASARVDLQNDATWDAIGFYSANPTIRALLSHEAAAVHLHGRLAAGGRGGHWNTAFAARDTEVEMSPIQDLVLRIRDLDKAVQPVRFAE